MAGYYKIKKDTIKLGKAYFLMAKVRKKQLLNSVFNKTYEKKMLSAYNSYLDIHKGSGEPPDEYGKVWEELIDYFKKDKAQSSKIILIFLENYNRMKNSVFFNNNFYQITLLEIESLFKKNKIKEAYQKFLLLKPETINKDHETYKLYQKIENITAKLIKNEDIKRWTVIIIFIVILIILFAIQVRIFLHIRKINLLDQLKSDENNTFTGKVDSYNVKDIFCCDKFLDYLIGLKDSFCTSILRVIILIVIFQYGLIVLSIIVEKTFILHGPEIGFVEQTHSMARMIVVPLFLILFKVTANKYICFIENINTIIDTKRISIVNSKKEVLQIIAKYFSPKSKYMKLKYSLITICYFLIIYNALNMLFPDERTGFYWWESSNYYFCWITNRFSWIVTTYLFVVMGYVLLMIFLSLFDIINHLDKNKYI